MYRTSKLMLELDELEQGQGAAGVGGTQAQAQQMGEGMGGDEFIFTARKFTLDHSFLDGKLPMNLTHEFLREFENIFMKFH